MKTAPVFFFGFFFLIDLLKLRSFSLGRTVEQFEMGTLGVKVCVVVHRMNKSPNCLITPIGQTIFLSIVVCIVHFRNVHHPTFDSIHKSVRNRPIGRNKKTRISFFLNELIIRSFVTILEGQPGESRNQVNFGQQCGITSA